jgi:histone H4
MARTKITITKTTTKRTRKFHPGTVAKRTARKLQKSTEFIIPKIQFRRVAVQAIEKEFGDAFRKSKAAMDLLQHATEDYMCSRSGSVRDLLAIGNTKTATIKNVRIMLKIRDEFQTEMEAERSVPDFTVDTSTETKRHKKYVDPLFRIPKTRIKHIFYKAGVLRISAKAIEEFRHLLSAFVSRIVRDALYYSVHANKRTISEDHVKLALEKNGYPIYG